MSDTQIVSARLPAELSDKVDRLAGQLDRPRAWIVKQAVDRYVRRELEFIAFVQEGEDAFERGETVSHEEMDSWFAERIADARARASDKAA